MKQISVLLLTAMKQIDPLLMPFRSFSGHIAINTESIKW
jgi:hypothetical protein